MIRNHFKALLFASTVAGTLAIGASAQAATYTGYICTLQVTSTFVNMTVYTQPTCGGSFLGSGSMFAPGQPAGSVVNYWPSQSRFDRLTSDLISNRWNKIRLEVDTGSGRNRAIASFTFDQS